MALDHLVGLEVPSRPGAPADLGLIALRACGSCLALEALGPEARYHLGPRSPVSPWRPWGPAGPASP